MEESLVGAFEVYETLRHKGLELLGAGRLKEALPLFDQAWAWAREHGDHHLIDRAYCNRSAVAVELEEAADAVAELREILLRSRDEENCFLAAYNIARAHEISKEYKKGLFYARIARDRAINLDRGEWLASSHNQIGDLLLADSFHNEATEEYERALELLGHEMDLRRAQIMDNLGYCRVLQGRISEGFELLYSSLRMLRRLGVQRPLVSTRLDLCFAHLEIGRYRAAERHGTAALELAQAIGHVESIKNALYLLGETLNLMGRTDLAKEHFDRLQRFYLDVPFLADFLLAIDVRKVINLKA